jgi:N-acetylglucosamine kinase-like BadF-type ATPase
MRIGLIDCGGTTTDIAFVKGNQVIRNNIEGFNPLTTSWEDFFLKLNQGINTIPICDRLDVYVSGYIDDSNDDMIKKQLQVKFETNTDNINIYSDLMAVSHAYYSAKSILAGIIGTGSNLAFYDGHQLFQNNPSLGFILGDEGGGVDLGKRLVRSYFYRELDDELQKKMEQSFNLDRTKFLSEIYSNVAMARNTLAAFVPFIYSHREHPQLLSIVESGFESYIQKRLLRELQGRSVDLIGFCGSVAYLFRNILERRIAKHTDIAVRICKSPLDELIKKHLHHT